MSTINCSPKKMNLDETPSSKIGSNLFPDDVCFEIIQYCEPLFVIKSCALISQQFLQVIKSYSKLSIKLLTITQNKIDGLENSQFLQNIETIGISLSIFKQADGKLLEILKKMTNLKRVNVSHNLSLLKCVFELPNLTCLGIDWCSIDMESVQKLGEMNQLTELRIEWSKIRRGVEIIGNLKNLTSLNLKGNTYDDEGIISLSQMSELRSLKMMDCNLETINEISNHSKLTELCINSSELTPQSAHLLAKLSKLTNLSINRCSIGDLGTNSISQLNQIKYLRACENGIGSIGARNIGEMKNLTLLELSGNRIGDDGLESIGKLSKLAYLDLGKNEITDQGLKSLNNLEKLVTLNLKNNKITNLETISHLKLRRSKIHC